MIERAYVWIFGESLVALGIVSLVVLGLAFEGGFRSGRQSARRNPKREGVGIIAASMMGLLSFALGLTISYAQERYEARRGLVVQEANAIGTAWLRASLVGGEQGPVIAKSIEELAKVELAFTAARSSEPEAVLIARRGALQDKIWGLTQTLVRRDPTFAATVMMTSINEMFDAELAERFAFDSRVPLTLSWMLLCGALLAISALGYQLGLTGVRYPVLVSLLLVMWTGGMVLITDLNRPRLGSIRIDPAPLVWTIEGFTAPSPTN